MAKAHADVAHDDGLAVRAGHGALGRGGHALCRGICGEVEGLAAHHEVAHAEGRTDHGHVGSGEVVDGIRVVAELLEEALLALHGLLIGACVLLVAKSAQCAVVCGLHPNSSLTSRARLDSLTITLIDRLSFVKEGVK